MVFMYHGAELVKKSSFHGPSGTRMLYQKTLTPPAFFNVSKLNNRNLFRHQIGF
jgi:hypothetical protein